MLTGKISDLNKFEKYLSGIVFLSVFAVYICFRTRNYYWDGIDFALAIENAPNISFLFHPNHLFYNVVGSFAYFLSNSLGFSTRALDILQILNVFFGAVSASVLFLILQFLTKRNYISLFFTFIFAFSATWWKFSTDIDSYIPSVLFLLISFFLILPTKKPRPIAVALTHTCAMFFHELAIFFFPVAVLGLYLQTKDRDVRRRIVVLLNYSLLAFLLTFGTYCWCFYLQTQSFDWQKFFKWILWYSPEHGFSKSLWNSLSFSLRGQINLFFNGRFNFLEKNPFLILLAVILAISFVILIYKLFKDRQALKLFFKTAAQLQFYSQPVALLSIVWIFGYLLFLFIFIPQNVFYRLFYLPPLIILLSLLVAKTKSTVSEIHGNRLALIAVIVFLSNFVFFIYPYSKVRNNTPLAMGFEMNRVWNEKSVIYYQSANSDNKLVKYVNPSTEWKFIEIVSPGEIESKAKNDLIDASEIWLETTVIDALKASPENSEWLRSRTNESDWYQLTDPAYNMKFAKLYLKSN